MPIQINAADELLTTTRAVRKRLDLDRPGLVDLEDELRSQFVTDFGASVYRGNPNAVGWIVPYLFLAPGLALVFWFIRRYRKPRPAPEIVTMEDANLARYREQIEKNLAHLE